MPISAAWKTDDSSSPEMPPDTPSSSLSEEQRRWIRDIAATINEPRNEAAE